MEEKKWFEDHRHLAEARRKRGITQAELAKEAGISQRLVSAIERGTRSFLEPKRLWEALAEIEVRRRIRAEKQLPKFEQPPKSRLSSLIGATASKVESEKPAEPLNAWGIINALGLDKSEAQSLREENEDLKAQLKTERELRELLERKDAWFVPMIEKIEALEKSNAQLLELLGIKTEEGILHWKGEELKEQIEQNLRREKDENG